MFAGADRRETELLSYAKDVENNRFVIAADCVSRGGFVCCLETPSACF